MMNNTRARSNSTQLTYKTKTGNPSEQPFSQKSLTLENRESISGYLVTTKSGGHCSVQAQNDDSNNMYLEERTVVELILQKKSEAILRKKGNEFFLDLEEISELLNIIDPAPSPLFRSIDQKAQDLSTYFLVAYSDSKDIAKSLHVYKTVKSLIRYIVLMDRYYEVRNLKYKKNAQQLLRDVKKGSKGHLKYTVSFALARCWPFWSFEKIMARRMAKGFTFSLKEIRYHNMFKSSDASSIYGSILDSELFHYTDNVGVLLHYNQAIQDAIDDFIDLEEDLYERLPNVFIMAAIEEVPFKELELHSKEIRRVIAITRSYSRITSLVRDYAKCAHGIEVPKEYEFLKVLTSIYLDQFIGLLEEYSSVSPIAIVRNDSINHNIAISSGTNSVIMPPLAWQTT